MKAAPEQIVAVLAAISGVGLTVTVRSKAAPVQVPLLGVSVYTMSFGVFVVFRSVWVKEVWATVGCALFPVMFALSVLIVQVYRVLAGTILLLVIPPPFVAV